MTSKVLTLATTELRLLLRNRTVAFSALGLPLVLGLFWGFTMDAPDAAGAAVLVALQLGVVLAMCVYGSATLTVVARRHARVLTRFRTTGLSDRGLLAATVAPYVVIGVGQVALFGVIDVVAGVPLPADPVPLVLALVGGLAMCVLAALATSIVTSTAEKAQYTTLPLTFTLLGAAVAGAVVPADGLWQMFLVVPGAAVGDLIRLAFEGGTWAAPGGMPVLLAPLAALALWIGVFGGVARRRFRWDDRVAAA